MAAEKSRKKPDKKPIKMTNTVIEKLKTEKISGEIFYDIEMPRFGVKVFPSGTKSFIYDYGRGKNRKRITIGKLGKFTLKTARTQARKYAVEVSSGQDPLEERKKPDQEIRLKEWVDLYIEKIKRRKKHPREDIRYLGIAVKRWGNRRLADIRKAQIEKIFNEYIDQGKHAAANWFLASVRACLQEAWRGDYIPSNPAMKIKSIAAPEPRRRVLNQDEYSRLENAVDKLKNPYTRAAFKLLMNTGARMSEVLHAKWENFDFENSLWMIPSTKSGKPQIMPLTDSMANMINKLPRAGTYVIFAGNPEKPSTRNPNSDKPRYDLKKPWAALKKASGISDVTIHDLRRTFGLKVTKRSGLHVASKLLRHSDIRVTERHYAPLEANELREALETLESHQDQ